MIDLNRAFAGGEPAFMDGLFPDGTWRRNLGRLDWGWFWSRFCPYGFLRTEKEDGSDKADIILEAEAKGFGSWSGPVAFFNGEKGPTYYYWPYSKMPDERLLCKGRASSVEED